MAKPNVLILFTDQQRYDTVYAAGYDYMITPNLDRLAEEGCTYLNARSSNPVCMPARHDLLTGLPGRAHGYYCNGKHPIKDYGIPTLPRIFSENGYRTVSVGKMHFYPARMHHGYSEMFLMEELPNCRQDDQYAMYLKKEGLSNVQNLHGVRPHMYHIPQNAQTDEKHHGSGWVADKTIEWLEENKENQFFLFAGWIQPHPPWNIPKELDGIYKDKDIPKAVPLSRDYPDCIEKNDWYGDFDSEIKKRKIREAYYSAITLVDKNVGRVLNYLEEKGILENTIVIFTSDHGEMLQDKGYYSKEVPYEGAVRVPLIIRYPEKFKAGEKRYEFADTLDIMPTCLDVCGLDYNGDKYKLPGESLCSTDPQKDRKHQISSSGLLGDRRWIMSRNESYKYVYNYNRGFEELYDEVNDKREIINLIKKGNYPKEVYEDLKHRAIEYEKEWGPEGAVVCDDFIQFNGEEFHGSVRGKLHYWSNSQMQYFDDRPKEERGKELIHEMEYALSNFDKSQEKLNEVFNNTSWIEDFKEQFNKYGVCKDYEKKIFSLDTEEKDK